MNRRRWIVALVLALALIGGLALLYNWLSDRVFVDVGQPGWEPGRESELMPAQPVGQTFVAHHAGLEGIELFLAPSGNTAVSLTLHLRDDPAATADLATASLELPAEADAGFYRLTFPPAADSHGRYYYAFLETNQPGVSAVLNRGDAYLDGAAYEAHIPLDAQTAFRLVYAPQDVVLDLLEAAVGWLGLLVIAGLLFIVPGWALLAWLWPGEALTWAEVLGLAGGTSLALYSLLMLWTDLVGLHLGSWYAWLPILAGLAALVWRYRSWRPGRGKGSVLRWVRSEALWPDLALMLTLGLGFAVRMVVVRNLDVGMWGDSYQHTMIAQLMVDNGGLFDSWEPYVPLQSFTYHYGFQAAVALYHWLTGTGAVPSLVIVGQIMNLLAVLALYPLALKVGGSRWTGVGAVLVAGLLSPMPLYYVNWGRYVQLAGQVVLPVAVWWTWSMLERRQRSLRAEFMAGLVAAGLMLTHYRVTIYYLLFLPLAWLAATVGAYRSRLALRTPFFRLVRTLLVMFVFLLPWVWRLFSGLLPRILGQFARSQGSSSAFEQSQSVRDTTRYVPVAQLVASGLGVFAGLVRKRWQVLLLVAWVGLWFLAANPNWLGLPGAVTVSNFEGVLNSFTVRISLYMPVSILCGYLLSTMVEALQQRMPWLRRAIAVGLVLVLALLGARSSLTILDTQYMLVTRPDLRAMDWIRKETDEDARFLANHFFAYDENVVVGSDAGWWIPLLAGRANTVPPITYGHETAAEPEFISQVNGLGRLVESNPLGATSTIQALRGEGITHVYIGQKGGSLSVQALEQSEAYDLVYHEDKVWIFEIH